MVNQAPRILSGRYEVGELIGRGGMAEVHIGHDSRLGRTVAIKILRSDLARDPSFQVRFRREAQAAASLNHPAIVAVYDTGEDTVTEPGGAVSHVPFIVMEYVEGHTVRDVLRDGSAVPIEEALEITAGILSALEYSHNAGIVHRDIKPANVMLTPTGAVKVMDFGIARALADSAATMTQTQAVIGTAQYLSPEQARGDQVDTRSDLYSTGCLLYELLTGRPPFTGDSPVAVAYQHVREIPRPPSTVAPDVPSILDAITLKALEKDREDRYATAAEFRAAIEAAARGEVIDPTAVTRVVPAPAVTAPATQVMAQQPAMVPAPAPVADWQNQSAARELLPDTEEEQDTSKKKILWALLSVALLAALVIAAIMILGNNNRPDMTNMPNLKGLTIEQAKEALKEANFTAEPIINHETSVEIPKDIFIRSEPELGATVDPSLPVTLWFSLGPASSVVPDVQGKSQKDAIAMLTDANLKVAIGVQTERSKDIPADHVTRTDPEKGLEVPEGTEVTLYVSDGFVDVPDITNKSLEEATQILEALGLKVNPTEEPTDDFPKGTIFDQSPAGGEAAKQGSTVDISIAKPVPPIDIPNLRNYTRAEAIDILKQWNLTPAFEDVYDDSVAPGNVAKTSPEYGQTVKPGGTVTLYISKGPEPTQEPEPPVTPDPTPEPPPAED